MHQQVRAIGGAAPLRCRRTSRYQPLVVVLLAVSLGMVVDRNLPWSAPRWWLLGAVGWLVWLALRLAHRERLATVCLLVCVAGLGGAWHHAWWRLFPVDDLSRWATTEPQPVYVELLADGTPRLVVAPQSSPLTAVPVGDRTQLRVRVVALRGSDGWQSASADTWLTVEGHLLGVNRGDRLRVQAFLAAPAGPQNPGEFDFATHLRAQRELARLWANHPACIEVIERKQSWGVAAIWDQLRREGNELLWRHIAPSRAGMAAALLLGSREQLDEAQNTAYFETGMIHMLSISGLHVGILAAGLLWLLRLLRAGRRLALIGVAGLTLLYAAVIEAEPPAVRATIVVLAACTSLYAGRPPLAFNALSAAALVVLAMNPVDLFRVGPQLSFLAAAVLGWFGSLGSVQEMPDPLKRLIDESRPWPIRFARSTMRGLGKALIVSCTIWLTALPLVMWQFHLVSPVALVLTPLLAVPIAATLLFGFGVLATGWLVPSLGAVFGKLCDLSLAVTNGTIDLASRLPGNHFWVVGPDLWWVISFYALLGFAVAFPRFVPRRRWCVAIIVGWSAFGLAVPLVRARDRTPVECTFLAVGHGCSVVVQLPGGKTLLYDAGRLGSPSSAARTVSSFLWSRGVTHLDAVVVSHADADHYSALPTLLGQFSVGTLYATPMTLANDSGAVDVLRRAIERAGVKVSPLEAGGDLKVAEGCEIRVLHPPLGGVGGSDNANSLVLAIDYLGRRILLTGDLEPPGLERVLAEPPLDTDVLLVPHHGSTRSDPPGFAAWSTPEYVVISGGRERGTEQVAAAYRDRGALALHTAECGAVIVRIDAEAHLRVQSFHGGEVPPRPWHKDLPR